MKRRHFIQTGATLGLSAGLLSTGCGSDNASTNNTAIDTIKNLTIYFEHDLAQSSQNHFNSLTQEEQDYLNFHFPNHTPSDTPHNHPNDELFIINHNGANKLNEVNISTTKSNQNILKSTTANTYSYESTTNKDNYAIHMFYKKINDNNTYIPIDEDDIVISSPPKYSLAALALIVPDGTAIDESITFTNSARETAKALIFSTPAFQHFSRDDLAYALSKFDDIFIGSDLSGNPIKMGTNLENSIKHQNKGQWYYYQAYREEDETATLRKTNSTNIDAQGNPIHKIGDPIYTFPLQESLAAALNDDLKSVIQYFSADSRLSVQLLPTRKSLSNTQKRVQNVQKVLLKKTVNNNGIQYNLDEDTLHSEGLGIRLNSVDDVGIHITASNSYNRHSEVLYLHLDQEGYAVGSIEKLGILSPRIALMSIPLTDSKKNFTIPIPSIAHSTRFFFGSLALDNGHNDKLYKGSSAIRDNDDDIKKILTNAEAYTIAFEMAIPSLLLLWGANLKRDASFNKLLINLGASFAIGIASPFIANRNVSGKEALLPILTKLGTSLLKAKNELAVILIKDISDAEAEDSMPIAGQIIRAINFAVDSNNLIQTLYAVGTAKAIKMVDLTRTHTLKLQLQSDQKDNDFPLNIDKVTVTLSHPNTEIKDRTYNLIWDRKNVISHSTAGGPTHSTYDISIDDVPAGGSIYITVDLKIGGWIAAHQVNEKADNLSQENIILIMKENLIPIGSNSIYQHYAKLTKSNGRYIWNVKPENGLFLPSPLVSGDNAFNNTQYKISVNDPIGAIGYSYKDSNSGLYVIKNISSVLETVNQGIKSITSSNMMQLSYNLLTSSSTDNHIVLESKNGLTYVRSIDIDSQSTDFKINFSQNIGMFISDNISQFAYYPAQNIIAGLDTKLGVLHILRHLDIPRDDNDTNRYLNAQSTVKTHSINTTVDVDPTTQYLYNPQILTMSPLGDIIILESTRSGNTRLRAFDKNGAVYLDYPGFRNNSGVFEFQEEKSVIYLDINIESKGYIYVLKYLGADSTISESYFLDIYDPESSQPNKPIVSTKGFSTAKIKVDYWRRVYAINYETTEDNEPTISIWLPPVPS